MSRDAFSHDLQDAGDARDASARRSVRQHRPIPPDSRDARKSAPEVCGRGDSAEVREQHPPAMNAAILRARTTFVIGPISSAIPRFTP